VSSTVPFLARALSDRLYTRWRNPSVPTLRLSGTSTSKAPSHPGNVSVSSTVPFLARALSDRLYTRWRSPSVPTFACPERQHHDRNQRGLLLLPESPTYFQPIRAGHHYVHENQVWLFGVGQFQGLITVLRAHDRVVGIFRNYDSMHQSTRHGIVDQENLLRQGTRSTLGIGLSTCRDCCA
jgi:hypothetical protein